MFLGVINLALFQIGIGYEYDTESVYLTTAVYALMGLFNLYFAVLAVEDFGIERSWSPIRKK